MAWIPFIRDYKPFYIQTSADAKAWGTEVYGLIAKSNPYPILPTPKSPYNNDWKDENGDDEYVEQQFFEAQELEVQFYCKVVNGSSSEKVLREQIRSFFEKIKQGEFLIYDSYTGIGRQRVHYSGYEEDSFVAQDGFARAIFTVKFKVNDPVTSFFYNEKTGVITNNAAEGRSDLLGTESSVLLVTESGFYIQVV